MLYHGSGTESWHSIIRNGLKNCSGTKLMKAALHGPGIYLSDQVDVSIGYTSGALKIVAIALVDNHTQYQKGGGIFVVPNEKEVKLKFLMVIHDNSSRSLEDRVMEVRKKMLFS